MVLEIILNIHLFLNLVQQIDAIEIEFLELSDTTSMDVISTNLEIYANGTIFSQLQALCPCSKKTYTCY